MARGNPRKANGHARRKARAEVEARHAPCWICGGVIDYAAPYMSPVAFVVDELDPVSKGGSPYQGANLAAAHRCCNNWRKAKSVDEVESIKARMRTLFGGWSGPLDFVAKAKRAMAMRPAKPTRQPRTTTDW